MKYLLIAGAFNLSNMALKEAQGYQDAESLVKHKVKKQRKRDEGRETSGNQMIQEGQDQRGGGGSIGITGSGREGRDRR
jgi:hypothetical protein